jgi:hypothetical protein
MLMLSEEEAMSCFFCSDRANVWRLYARPSVSRRMTLPGGQFQRLGVARGHHRPTFFMLCHPIHSKELNT